ncbi:putative helicase [Desulforapulum autotrophicum HRM2]|uniref:Helicase n=1 Tax=Desulforapulum autotrophicum (strain ATCC 43914 / DSM 3382 / VKM B-1955 / HRM2) TaxID=177437 RepID=C0QH99_DESAH|nr:DEAD/DEAH box helicase [Desulforapulum autotrophicum]ACN17758.1 putative helicase [Desulforapulum autotrophicum HRM2]
MALKIETLFESLKKTRPIIRNAKIPDAIAFRITSEVQGVCLTVIDGEGKEVDPEYEFYSGSKRSILKEISRIKEQEAFTIEWEAKPGDRSFYIDGNEYLVSMLLASGCLVDGEDQKIELSLEKARVKLSIHGKSPDKEKSLTTDTPQETVLEASMGLWLGAKQIHPIIPVTETHILSGTTIYQVTPLGRHFNTLTLFETTLGPELLEQYLTMLFSNLSNVEIDYSGFKLKQGSPKTTRPALIFDNVTPDKTLHLRVSATYSGFSPDFFDNFDLDKIVSVNEMERTITVSPLVHGEISDCFREIQTMLKKHSRSLKQDNGLYVEDNFMVVEPALAETFITQELAGLLARYMVLGAEKLKSYRVKYVQPTLGLKLSHGIDFLEGEGTLELAGEKFSINDVLKQYQKSTYVRLSDGTSALINPEYMRTLSRIFKRQKSGIKVSFFDLPVVEELIGEKVAQKTFKRSRDIFLGFNRLKTSKKRLPKINATLRGYQKQGVRWASYLYKHKLGGCLADDMGLGKTIQTIALFASIYPRERHPTLVVMPKTLLFNWASELERFTPNLTFITYYGPLRDISHARKNNIILTTYAVVRNDIETLKDETFHAVVLDESQQIKNLNSKISKAVMLLNADHRLALSGTPIENNLGELYALFRFLNPSMFGTTADFSRNYLTPIQKDDNKTAVKELKKKIYPFILRRLKGEVLKELPDKMEQTLYVDMTADQERLYHQRRLMYKNAIKEEIAKKGLKQSQLFVLQALGELRQIASIPEIKSDNQIISPKREVLMEHVTEAVAGNHKVLIFANFLHSLDCISLDMEKAGLDHLVMTGATRDRSAIVERFQTDNSCAALMMTLKTGGLGLNLTAADYVFLFDPWWNVAAENQAIDRAHRMGQKNTVFSYRLIARNTIEEKILKLQAKKKALFDSLIAADNASIKQMDEADIDYVLGE